MRTNGVVIDSPRPERSPRFFDAHEQMLVEALVPAPAVETLHDRVLNGLARADEAQLHAACMRPGIDSLAAELRAVVAHDRSGHAAIVSQTLENGYYVTAGQATSDFAGKAFAAEVVDHV